ncbi:sugar phosphorylase [Bacillus shivajii]|uniref:alpha-amylase family glycosyl hydrolase n=1 Tax=Bacillus shivajii TaxID=1983719 RepID=UPI001CFBFB61|nr:alpha-amylase family glycosyl hydrolase [Bacillus shivajii]UCZ52833.1 sugar phosphorylase [Bacillus shivajii]
MEKRWEIPSEMKDQMESKLVAIYGEEKGKQIYPQLEKRLQQFKGSAFHEEGKTWVDESDVMLITYGDQIKENDKPNLQSLHEFMNEYLDGVVSAVHILPFYPYSSDDGFSVIDYFEVNPELGEWKDVEKMAEDFEIMFDAVINHISAKSDWFEKYLAGDETYKKYFIEADRNADYSTVTRPRALPLLSEFDTAEGKKYIWTTFSADQIDLNYENEEVLLKIVELLLFYVEKGAKMLRLDAIGYMWKELGTSCIHLEEAHKLIQLFRDIFETVSPETIMITETNVPHKDNISYFGNGYNEAQMVYQFPLPPLTLHSFHTGDASYLSKWAAGLERISDQTTYFNFLASHDGIGVMPAKGILSEKQVNDMAEKVRSHGGNVSMKANGDGTESPYELNINYFEALSHPDEGQEVKVKRFLASQSVLLSLIGVPGIYVHSLLGSNNYHDGVEETGRFRTINREKLNREQLESELETDGSQRNLVFNRYKELIKIRRQEKAFDPNGEQDVLFLNDSVFTLKRTSKDKQEEIVAMVNVSEEQQDVTVINNNWKQGTTGMKDLISGETFNCDGDQQFTLAPYSFMWLKGE